MGGKLGKSEKSSQAGVGFVEFLQGPGGISKEKGTKKTPMALFRVVQHLFDSSALAKYPDTFGPKNWSQGGPSSFARP